jgi:tetratricopeptide (TPR) repeat protein
MSFRPIACFVVTAATTIAAPAQNSKSLQSLSVSMPGNSWSLVVDAPGFAVESQGRKPDGREYLLANNAEKNVVLSITLERSPKGADPKTCPDYLHSRAQSLASFGPTNIKYSEIAHMPVLEYFIPQTKGMPVKQQSFVACTAKDDVYIDIHLSKVQFQASERPVFVEILNAVHFSEEPSSLSEASGPSTSTKQDSMEFFQEGSRHFLQRDYHGAIAPYQAALDLEKKQPRLSKNYWRVLVDNLGMAYGITGDLDHSEKVYQYGISKDPNFPSFYYSIACVFAERGDMDKTMDYLRKSFSLKANVLPGESMPDPAKDDSFQRFMSNEKFRDFVKSLNASN